MAAPPPLSLLLDGLRIVERHFAPRGAGAVDLGRRALNQSGFEALVSAMGLVNGDWGGRLFAAMDGDATGALGAAELLHGLRVMAGQAAVADPAAARRRLAFAMLDLDGDGRINRDELREFVQSFAAAARRVTEGWVGQFEELFGGAGAWREGPELRRALLELNVQAEEAVDELCGRVSAAAERVEDDAGDADEEAVATGEMSWDAFGAWCKGEGGVPALGIEAVLGELASAWVRWMGLTQRERESGPSLLPTQAFAVQGSPGICGTFDGLAERGLRPLFDAFADHDQMSEGDFHRCLARLGVAAAHFRSRLFVVFGDGGIFVDFAAFSRMARALMDDDAAARHYLAFRLFDADDNGFVTETEVRDFVVQFLREATAATEAVLAHSRQLFGDSNRIHTHADTVCTTIVTAFSDSIVSALFDAQEIAPGPGGQRRVYQAEFAAWIRDQGGDQFSCWLDSLAGHILETLVKMSRGFTFTEPPSSFGASSEEVGLLRAGIEELEATTPVSVAVLSSSASTSSRFTRHKVKSVQDLFTKVSRDGVMGPAEWRRCLTAAGIQNTFVIERLFELFDASGDKTMTAKEFSDSLSELVNDQDPRGELSALEARRFAFRFFDANGDSKFERRECVSFLKSWVICARDAIRLANEKFLDVYGIEQIDITAIQSPKQRTARSTVTGLYEHVYEQLDAWCADVWSNFVRNKKMPDSLNEDDWVRLASAAPQTFEWLSDLGRQLGQQLEKLRDMNFESMQRPVSAGTELSIVRMKQTFAASAHQGAMDRSAFTRCVKGLLGTESSKGFASALFHAVDVNKNDSLSQDEFVDAFTTIVQGTPQQKASIAFRIHDTRGVGFLEPKTLASSFCTWLEPSLEQVDLLSNSLDEWMNGRIDPSGARKGALGSCFDGAARLRNTSVCLNVKKAGAREVAVLADALVEHAMQHSSRSSHQLFPEDFERWIQETSFLLWLEQIGASWLVTPEQLENETPPSEKRRARTAALMATAASERERLAKMCPSGESYFGLRSPATANASKIDAFSLWWARCFAVTRRSTRRQMRPETSFDRLTLSQLWTAVEQHVADRTAFDRSSFGTLMHSIRVENPFVVNVLFDAFDSDRSGNLSVEEVAAALGLLARGGSTERLRFVFDAFDSGCDGTISRAEMHRMLHGFRCVAMGVVEVIVGALLAVCGLIRPTKTSSNDAKEFQQKLIAGARSRLQHLTSNMLKDFASYGSGELSLDFFELWAGSSPVFSCWLDRLGLAFLHCLVPLEERLAHPATERSAAACRLQRKWPDGTPFRRNSVSGVIDSVARYSTAGRLHPSQLRACLCDLNVRSPLSARRVQLLLDRNCGGSVSSLEAATTLLLLCSAPLRERLRGWWETWDTEKRGFLSLTEMGLIFEVLFVVAMDTVHATVGTVNEVLGESDEAYSHMTMALSYRRLRAYIDDTLAQIRSFCARDDEDCIHFERFCEWAQQRDEFSLWLDCLADSWADALLDCEADPNTAGPPAGRLRTTELEPATDGPTVLGPAALYPYTYRVTKTFNVVCGSSERRMRVAWTNPYSAERELRLVSERPELLSCAPATCTLAAGASATLSLRFAPWPELRRANKHTLRLWVHDERGGRNEECLAFEVRGVAA